MSKGTILYIGGFELPDRNAAAHRVINNARIFRELGYDVVFCGVDKELSENCKERQDVFGFDSFPVAYPISAKKWVLQMLDIEHYVSVLEKYPSVTHIVCYNLHAVPLKNILSYAKKKNIKVISDCTEWYENKFSLNPIRLVKWADTFMSMRVLQKKCDGIIAISKFLKNYYGKHIKKIIVVPPLVDITEEKWHQEPEKKTNKISFVYSGQPGDTKDKIGQIVDCFLKTGNILNCVFRVVGIKEEEFYNSYPEMKSKENEIRQFVEFFGRVPHKQSIKELFNADYCIFIRDRSRKNMAGFPTKFVECFTSGISIIANNISDIENYFPDDEHSILIENNTSEEICEALNKALLAGNPTRRVNESNPFDYRQWIDQYKIFLER